ncbi:MAG: hypothetical protein DLM50_04320 [Candidatus Meridianibacter frigidus]|nr:MAG: hypothetical protein DLM50_04320 [Candidatus Eremiobacteraeota bacterium]
MTYYAGIDAGQSATKAVIGDAEGRVIGHGSGPPADEVAQSAASTRLHDALRVALEDASRDAGLQDGVQFRAIVAGISGYEGRVYGHAPALPSANLQLVHDSIVAHVAAFGEGPGVVVIAGTGTVAYGTDASGESVTLGGWGYLFGDEGGAFWIGRRLIERAMRDEDVAAPTRLESAVLKHFDASSLRALARAFYSGEIERRHVAAFAQHAFEMQDQRIEEAAEIIRQAADRVAALGAQTARRLHGNKRVLGEPAPLAFTGGLMRNADFARLVAARARDRLPEAVLVSLTREPEEGALALARRYG